nr:zinc finger protein Xfin-like [Parasteatoda tepidariorum]
MSVADNISITPTVKREIICQICNKSFKRGKDLKSHSVIHLDAKPYVCSQCPEAFKHKTSLKRHSLIHSGEKPFTCRICGKSFRQKGSLNEHSLTHSGVKPHTCDVCNMGFTTKSNYGRHLKKHLLSKPFTCNICNKGFNVRSYLTRHYNKHKEIDETINSLTSKSQHKFSSADEEDKKLSSGHSEEKQLPCTKVIVNAEMVEVTNHLGLKTYVCRKCKKHFNDFSNLKIHLMSHVNKKIYVCDVCKSSFTSIGAFCKHKLAHSQDTFKCEDFPEESEILPQCLKTAASNTTLNIKTEYSDKEALDKRYVCSVCNRTFLKEIQFMHHSVTHKYPGPYYCDICGENIEFDKIHELHKHYEEHGEIACICYNCIEESGIVETNVNYSKNTVFKCDICYKCFPDKNLLRKHFPTHKNRRPLLIKLST